MTGEQWKNFLELLDERDRLRGEIQKETAGASKAVKLESQIYAQEDLMSDFITTLEAEAYAKAQKSLVLNS